MDGLIDGYTALDGHTLAGHFDTLKMYLNVGFPYQVQIADVERLAANDIRFVPEVPLPLDMFQLNGIYSNDDKCLMNAGATGLREPQFLGPTYDVRLDTWSELSERYLYYGLRHQMHNGRFPTPAEYYSHEYTLFRNWRHPNPNLLFAPDTDVVLQKLRLAKVYQESRDRYYNHPLLLFCSRTERTMNDHMLEDYDDDLFILHFQGCHVFGFHKFVIRWSDEEQSPVRYIVNIFTGTLYTADPFKGAAGWSVEQRQMYIYETALTVHICETIITNSAGGVPRQVLPILYPRRMAIEYEEESCASSNASGVSERSDRSQEQMEEEEQNEEPQEERMETEEQPSQEAKADEIDTYRVNGKDRLVFDEASLMAAGRFDAGHYDSYRVQPQSMNENPLPDNFLEDSPPKNSSNNRGSPTNLETQLRDTSIQDRDHNRNEKQQHQTNGNNDTGNGSNKNTSEHLEDNANKNAVEEPKEQPQEAKATFAAPSNRIDWSILYAKRKPGAKVPASSPLGFLANKNSQAPLGFLANKSRHASLAFLANRNRQPASEAEPVATVPPVEQLQKPTVNPLEQQQSPAVSPLEQQQSPAVSPLEQQQSPAVSPAAQMKSPAISSEEQQQSLAVDPMEQQKSRAISPMEQQKSPAVNPAEQLKSPAISSLAPLKGPAIRPAEQLESSAIHPLEEQKSPAVSPLEETTKSVVSPLELPKTVVSPVEQSTKPAVSPLQQRKAPSADPFAQLKSQSTKTVQEQKPPATSAKLQTMMQRRAAERPKPMSVFDAMLKRKKETAAAAPAAPIAQPVRKQNLASLFAKPAEKKDPVSTVAPTWALGMKVTTNKTKKKDEPVEKKVPIVESHSARGFIGFHFRKPGEESPISSRSASPARAKRSNESPMQAYVRTSRIDQTPVASQPTSRDQSPVVPPTPAPSRESSYESVRSSTRSSQLSSGSDSSSTTSSDRSSSISASQISQRTIPSPVPPKALILSPFEALRSGGQLLKPQIPPPQPEPIVASSTPSSETPGGSTQVPAAQPASDEKVQEPNLASLSLQEPVEEPAKILENTMNGLSLRSVYQGPSGEEDNQPVPSYNHNDQPESSVVDETYPLEEFMEPPGPSGQHSEHQSSSGRPMEQVNSTLKNDDQPRPSANYSEPTRPQPLPPVHRPSQQTVPLKKQTVRIVYSPLPKVSTTQAAVSSPSPPAADTSKTAKPNETLEAYRKRTQMKAKEQSLSVAPSPSSPAVIVRSATNGRTPIYVPARSDQPLYYLMQKPNLPVPVVTRNPARPGARGGRAAPRPAARKIQAMEGNEPPTTTSPAIRYVSVSASSLTTDAPVLDSHIWDKQVNNEKEVNREPSAVSFPTQNGQLDPNNEQISPGGASTLQQKKKSVPRKAATQKTRQPRKTRAKKSTPPPLEETEEREPSTPYEYQPMPETQETEDSSDQSDAPVYRRWLREWPYDEHNYAELDDGINSKNVKMPPGRNKLAVVLEGIKLEKQPEEEQPRVDNPDVPSTSAERPRSPTPVPAGPKRGRPHKGQEIQWTPAVAPNEPKRNPRTRTRNNPDAPPVDTVGVTHERKPKTKKIPIKIEPIEEEPIEKEPIEEEAGCSKEIEKEPEPEEEEKPAPEKRGRGRPKKVVRPRGRKGALMRKIATALEHAYYRTHKKKVPPELERIPEEEMAELLRQADEYEITRGEFTVLTRPVPIEPEEIPKIKPKACKLPGLINLLRKLVANSSLLKQELTQEVLDQLVDVVSSQKLSEVQHRIQELVNQQDELKKKKQAALLAVKDLLEPMINELESFDLAPLPYHDKGSEIEDEETFEEIPSCSESATKAMNEINNMILPQLMANAVLVRTATLDETQTSRLSEIFTDVMDNKKMNVLEEGAEDVNNIVSQDKRDLFNETSTTLTDDEETTLLEDLPLKVDAPSSHESESIADYLESNVSNHATKAVPHAEEGVNDVSEENYADNEVSKAVDSCILNEEEAEPATSANALICSGEGNERKEYKEDEVRDIPSAIEKSAHIDSNLPLELLQPVCEAEQSSYVAQEKLDEDILDYSSEPSARYESDANESVSAASEPELEETSIESEQAPCQEDIVESKSLDVRALDDEVTEAEVLKPVEKHITNGPASAEEEYHEMVDDHSGLEDLVCAGEDNERDDQDKDMMRNIPSTIETAPTESVIPVELLRPSVEAEQSSHLNDTAQDKAEDDVIVRDDDSEPSARDEDEDDELDSATSESESEESYIESEEPPCQEENVESHEMDYRSGLGENSAPETDNISESDDSIQILEPSVATASVTPLPVQETHNVSVQSHETICIEDSDEEEEDEQTSEDEEPEEDEEQESEAVLESSVATVLAAPLLAQETCEEKLNASEAVCIGESDEEEASNQDVEPEEVVNAEEDLEYADHGMPTNEAAQILEELNSMVLPQLLKDSQLFENDLTESESRRLDEMFAYVTSHEQDEEEEAVKEQVAEVADEEEEKLEEFEDQPCLESASALLDELDAALLPQLLKDAHDDLTDTQSRRLEKMIAEATEEVEEDIEETAEKEEDVEMADTANEVEGVLAAEEETESSEDKQEKPVLAVVEVEQGTEKPSALCQPMVEEQNEILIQEEANTEEQEKPDEPVDTEKEAYQFDCAFQTVFGGIIKYVYEEERSAINRPSSPVQLPDILMVIKQSNKDKHETAETVLKIANVGPPAYLAITTKDCLLTNNTVASFDTQKKIADRIQRETAQAKFSDRATSADLNFTRKAEMKDAVEVVPIASRASAQINLAIHGTSTTICLDKPASKEDAFFTMPCKPDPITVEAKFKYARATTNVDFVKEGAKMALEHYAGRAKEKVSLTVYAREDVKIKTTNNRGSCVTTIYIADTIKVPVEAVTCLPLNLSKVVEPENSSVLLKTPKTYKLEPFTVVTAQHEFERRPQTEASEEIPLRMKSFERVSAFFATANANVSFVAKPQMEYKEHAEQFTPRETVNASFTEKAIQLHRNNESNGANKDFWYFEKIWVTENISYVNLNSTHQKKGPREDVMKEWPAINNGIPTSFSTCGLDLDLKKDDKNEYLEDTFVKKHQRAKVEHKEYIIPCSFAKPESNEAVQLLINSFKSKESVTFECKAPETLQDYDSDQDEYNRCESNPNQWTSGRAHIRSASTTPTNSENLVTLDACDDPVVVSPVPRTPDFGSRSSSVHSFRPDESMLEDVNDLEASPLSSPMSQPRFEEEFSASTSYEPPRKRRHEEPKMYKQTEKEKLETDSRKEDSKAERKRKKKEKKEERRREEETRKHKEREAEERRREKQRKEKPKEEMELTDKEKMRAAKQISDEKKKQHKIEMELQKTEQNKKDRERQDQQKTRTEEIKKKKEEKAKKINKATHQKVAEKKPNSRKIHTTTLQSDHKFLKAFPSMEVTRKRKRTSSKPAATPLPQKPLPEKVVQKEKTEKAPKKEKKEKDEKKRHRKHRQKEVSTSLSDQESRVQPKCEIIQQSSPKKEKSSKAEQTNYTFSTPKRDSQAKEKSDSPQTRISPPLKIKLGVSMKDGKKTYSVKENSADVELSTASMDREDTASDVHLFDEPAKFPPTLPEIPVDEKMENVPEENEEPQTDHEQQPTNDEPGIEQESEKDQENNMEETPTPVKKFDADVEPPVVDSPEGRQPEETDRYKIYKFLSIKCGKDGKDHPVDEVQMTVEAQVDDNRKATVEASCMPNHSLSEQIRRPAVAASPVDEEMLHIIALSQKIKEDSRAKKANFQPKHDSADVPPNQAQDDRKRKAIEMENPNKRARCEYEDTYGNDSNTIHMGQPSTSLAQNQCLQQPYEEKFTFSQTNEESSIYGTGEQDLMAGIFSAQNMHTMPVTVQQGFDNSCDILSAATAAADILAPDERLPPPADPAVALYVEKLINLPECTQPDLYKNRSVPPMQNTPESVGSVPNHGSLPMQSHDRIEEIPYSNMSTVPGQQFGQQNMTIPPHMQPMNQGGQNWNRTMPRDSPRKLVEENMNCPPMQPHGSGSIPIMQMDVNSVQTCPNGMQQRPNLGYVDAMVHQHPGQHPNLPAHQNPQLQSQRLLAQGPPMQISPLIAGQVHDIRMQPRQASYPQGHAPAHVYAMPPSLIVQPVHNPYPAPVVKEPPSRVHSRGTTKAARNKKSAVEAGTSRQMSLVHMQHHPPVHNTQHVVDPMMMQHPRFYNNCMQPSTPMQPNKPIITRSERNAGLENQHDWTNTSFGGNAVSGNLPGFPQVPSRKEPIGQFGSYIIPMRHPQTPAPQYLLRQQNYPSTSNQHQDYMMQNATSNMSQPMHHQPYPPEAFNRMQFQQQQQPLEWENPQMLQQHQQQRLQQQQHQPLQLQPQQLQPQQSFNYSQDHQMLDQQHIQQQQQQEDRFYPASADSNMHQQEHREEYHRQYPPFAPAPMDPQPEQHWETNADEPQMSTSVQETQRQTPETSENAEVTVECPQPPTADPKAPRCFSDRLADFIRKSMYKTVINDSPNPDKVMVKTLASEITNVAKFNVMKGRHVTIARLRKKVKFLDRRLESLTEPLPGDEDWANVPSRNQALKTVPPRTAAIVRWKASDGEPTKNGDVETLGKKEDANLQKVYQICKKTFTWMKVPRRRKITCFHVQFFNPCVQGDPEDLGSELLCCHDYFVQNVVITFLDTPYNCIRYGPMKEFNALGSKKQKLSTDPHSDIQAYLHYLDEECCHLDLRSTQDPSARVLYVLWNRQLSACLNDIFEAREPMNNPHDDGISDQESGPGQGSGPSSSMHGGSFERNTQGHSDAHSYPHHQGYSMRMSRLSTMNKEEVNFLMRRNPELTVVLPTTPFRYCFALESFGTFKLDVLDHFSHFESALRRMRESFSTITSDLKNYVNYSRSTVADTHLSVFSVSRHSWTFCILEMAKQIFTPTKCVDFQKLDKIVYTDAVDKFSSAMSKLFDGKAIRSTLKKLERETKKMPTGMRDKYIKTFIFNMLRQTFIPEALLKKLETKPLWDAKARTNVAAIRTVSSCYDISSTCSDLNDIFNKPFTNGTVETLRRHIQTMGGTSRKAQQRNRWQSATKTSFVFEETYNSLKMYEEEARGVLRDLQSTAPINPEMVVLNALHGLPDYVAKMTLSRYIAQRCDILMEITVKSANKAIQRANMSINSMSKVNVSASVQALQLVFDTNLSSYGPKFYNLLAVGEIKTESPEEPPPAKERNPKRPASAATLPSVPAKSIRSEDSLTKPRIPIEPSILLPPSQPSLPSTSSSTVTSVAKKLAYAESHATADSGFASVPSIVLSTSDAPTSTARMAAEDGNKANVPLVIQSDLDFVLPLFDNTPMNSPSADSVESFRTKKMKKQRATISPMRLNNRLRLLAEAADVVEGRSRSSSIDREGSSQPEPKVRKIPPARVLPKKHIVNSVVSDGKHKYSVKVDYFSRSAQIDRKLTVPRTKKLRPEDEPAPIIAHLYNQGIREVKLVLKDDGKPDWPKMKELAAEPPLTPRTPRLPKKSDSRSQSPTERARQHSSGAARKLFRKPLLMTELIPGGDTSKEGSPATSDSETLKRERHAQSDALREQSVASTATISSTESRHLDSDDADSDVEADKLQIVTDDEESGIDEASPELNDYYYENKHQDDLPLDLSMPKVIQPEPVVVHPKNMKVEARFDSPAKPADWEILNWDKPGSSKSLTSSWENLAMLRISHHPVSAPQDLSAKGPEPPISQLQKLTFKEIPPTPEVPKTKTITPKLKSKKKYATPCKSMDKYILRKTTRFAEILTEDEPPEIATDLTQHFDNMDSLRSAVDAAEKERKRMFTTVACDTAFRRRETTTRSRRLVAPKIAKRSKSADRWLGRTIYKHYGEFWQLGLARLGQPTVQRVPKKNQFEQVSRCNTPATISPWDDDYQNCFDEEVPQSQKLVFPVHESFKQAERVAIRNPATVWKTHKPDSPDDKDGGKPAGPRFFRSRRNSRK